MLHRSTILSPCSFLFFFIKTRSCYMARLSQNSLKPKLSLSSWFDWFSYLSSQSTYRCVPPCLAINFIFWICTWTSYSNSASSTALQLAPFPFPFLPLYLHAGFLMFVISNLKVDSLLGQPQEETGQPASMCPSFLYWPITSLVFSPKTPTVLVEIVWGWWEIDIPFPRRSRKET